MPSTPGMLFASSWSSQAMSMVNAESTLYYVQVKGSRWLKLSANSTRRAHWAARLGLHCLSQPPTFPLSSLYIDGGMVPAVKVSFCPLVVSLHCVSVVRWLYHGYILCCTWRSYTTALMSSGTVKLSRQ